MEKKKSPALVYYLCCLLLTIAAFVIPNAFAETGADSCQKVIVVGDINWPPYATNNNSVINGVGIELLQKVFAELDIPVQVIRFNDKSLIFNGLHLGDIDILASTYRNKDVEEMVNVIKPSYLVDPLVVYMRKDTARGIKRWDDLVGKRGVTSDNFIFNSNFTDYIDQYLDIQEAGDLATVIDLVNTQLADYVIGSKRQLEHGIKQANLQGELVILATLSRPDEVYMGYSKRSLCKAYMPYLHKRLIEFKKDGIIDEVVESHVVPEPTTPHLNEF